MTADRPRAAERLRDLVEHFVNFCAQRARGLERCVMSLGDESKAREKLLGDVERMHKIAERTQKMLADLRKGGDAGPCDGSCQTFAAAMLEAQEAAGSEGAEAAHRNEGPAGDGPRGPE